MLIPATISGIAALYVLFSFAASATGKSLHFSDFRLSLRDSFPALPFPYSTTAWLVVASEWLVAMLLLSNLVLAGSALASFLSVGFGSVIAWSLLRGKLIVCNCFGIKKHKITVIDLAKNISYVLACLIVAVSPPDLAGIPALGKIAMSGIALILVLFSIYMHDLIWLLRANPEV